VQQDKSFVLPVDFALERVLLGVVAGTAKIMSLSVEDGYLNLSIRAKVESIQFGRDGIGMSPEPVPAPILAPMDYTPVDRKSDHSQLARPIDDRSGPSQETVSEERQRRANQVEGTGKGPGFRDLTELEELDDKLSASAQAQPATVKPALELEEL
jgi:hypothetical protein